MFEQQRRVLFPHLDDFGDEQELPRDAPAGKGRLQLLVDDALVGGVLVHEHHAAGGFGNDVGLVKLGARGAERLFGRLSGRAGRGILQCGLRLLGEAPHRPGCGPRTR